MILPKKFWEYQYVSAFYNKVFGDSITELNIMDNGKLFHQESVFEISTTSKDIYEYCFDECIDDKYFYKINKDGKLYLLPKRFIHELPCKIVDTIDVRLKKCDTTVYKLIRNIESLYIPAKKTMTHRQFVDNWNPIGHTNQRTWTFLKMYSFAQKCNIGICATTGSGKNSNLTLCREFGLAYDPEIIKPSRPMFWLSMRTNDRLNIDEITSWTKGEVKTIEEEIAKLTDKTPRKNKHSLGKGNQLEGVNISNKGCSFTFNPVTDKNPYTFCSRFSNGDKILDRVPLLLLEGTIDESLPTPRKNEIEQVMKTHFNDYANIAMNLKHFSTNIHQELHGYDRTLCPFTRRHKDNTQMLIDHIDAYCNTQDEFSDWMKWLKQCIINYDKMITEAKTK